MKPSAVAVAVFLIAVAGYSIHVKAELRETAGESTAVKVGSSVLPISLRDRNGNMVDLSEVLKTKKLVLVNFWATWCPPCRVEMPQFEKIYKKHKDAGFEILAISVDEDISKRDEYLNRKPVSFPILLDPEGTSTDRYGIRALPTSILVDRKGIIRNVFEGAESGLEWQVKHLLDMISEEEAARHD